MNKSLNSAVPTSPLVDEMRNLRPEWRSFFTGLWLRTGGAIGISNDSFATEAELTAETAARQQGDTGLGNALDNEAQIRHAADTQEAQARQQADIGLTNSLRQETTARQTADALLVPKTQLCTLWAACDLSFLPLSDPGLGKPWLDGAHIAVGTPAGAMVGIGLEDATGDWTLQDGSGHWIWS